MIALDRDEDGDPVLRAELDNDGLYSLAVSTMRIGFCPVCGAKLKRAAPEKKEAYRRKPSKIGPYWFLPYF